MTDFLRVLDKAETLPDSLEFLNGETGDTLEDIKPLILDKEEKLMLAYSMLTSKQSLETVVLRAIRNGLKESEKRSKSARH